MYYAEPQQINEDLESALLSSPLIRQIFARWSNLGLSDCWLVSGAVAQTYWNHRHGFSLEYGIEDMDLVYFDAEDISAETEDSNENRIAGLFRDLTVPIDVKNQARVHLWYTDKFGFSIPPHESVKRAIGCFPTVAGSIGIRPVNGALECYSAFGISDLLGLTVRPNKRQAAKAAYEAKAARWGATWPKLNVLDWNDSRSHSLALDLLTPRHGAA